MLNFKDIMNAPAFRNSMNEANKNRYSENKVEIPFRVRFKSNISYPAIINNVTYNKEKKYTKIKFEVFNEKGESKDFDQIYSDNDYAQEILEGIIDKLLYEDEWDSLSDLIGKACIVKLVKKNQYTNVKVISRCLDEENDTIETDSDMQDYYDMEEEDYA